MITLHDSIGAKDSLTGIELLFGNKLTTVNTAGIPSIWLALALVAAVSRLLYNQYSKGVNSYAPLFTLGGVLFLVLFQLGSDYNAETDDVRNIDFLFGYWMQLVLFLLSAITDIYKMSIKPSKHVDHAVSQLNINIITQIQSSGDPQNNPETPNKQFPADNQLTQ